MKTGLIVVLILAVLVGGGAGFYFYSSHNSLTSHVALACSDPDSVSRHIYDPSRLETIKPCVTVSGTVDGLRGERDGDYHVLLGLDAAYANLTNSANDQLQQGDLVVEIICVLQVTQSDAVSACKNYTNHIPIPQIGRHIVVSGPYVRDLNHSGWAEIHPVYSLVVS